MKKLTFVLCLSSALFFFSCKLVVNSVDSFFLSHEDALNAGIEASKNHVCFDLYEFDSDFDLYLDHNNNVITLVDVDKNKDLLFCITYLDPKLKIDKIVYSTGETVRFNNPTSTSVNIELKTVDYFINQKQTATLFCNKGHSIKITGYNNTSAVEKKEKLYNGEISNEEYFGAFKFYENNVKIDKTINFDNKYTFINDTYNDYVTVQSNRIEVQACYDNPKTVLVGSFSIGLYGIQGEEVISEEIIQVKDLKIQYDLFHFNCVIETDDLVGALQKYDILVVEFKLIGCNQNPVGDTDKIFKLIFE